MFEKTVVTGAGPRFRGPLSRPQNVNGVDNV
jgi:hypothetical protein